jgi:peroxiredoxin
MMEFNSNRRKLSLKPIVLLLMVILGVAIIFLLQTKDDYLNLSGKKRLDKGVAAPNFVLPDLDGKLVSLADYKGKVVLLNIWATWCPPCVQEMPSMEKLYQTMKGEDFDILAISIDEAGAEAVDPFIKKHKLSFTALIDPKGILKYQYQITGVPESYIIDKKGMIVEKIIGPRDWAAPEAVRFFRDLAQKNE